MNVRFIHCFAVLLLFGSGSGFGSEAAKKAAGDWERELVSIEVHRKQYDYFQPWTKRVQTVVKAGLLIGPREILTTADGLDNRTLVRLQKGGRGPWWSGGGERGDFSSHLPLVTHNDGKMWAGVGTATRARPGKKEE